MSTLCRSFKLMDDLVCLIGFSCVLYLNLFVFASEDNKN